MNTGSNKPGEAAVAEDRTGTDDEAAPAQALGSRAPEFIKARRALHLSWQVGVFIVGLAVVAAGAAMLVLPGPGWVVIFGGMAIWATEFVWAQLVLRWTKRKVTEAAQRALDPKVRRRNIILTSVGLVIVAAVAGSICGSSASSCPGRSRTSDPLRGPVTRPRWSRAPLTWGNVLPASGRLAQWESASFTPKRSLVRTQYRPPDHQAARLTIVSRAAFVCGASGLPGVPLPPAFTQP